MMVTRQLKSGVRRRGRGFTLVELLVATALMAVILTVVVSLTGRILSAWNASTVRLTLSYQAQAVLDILADDLASSYWDRTASGVNRVWMAHDRKLSGNQVFDSLKFFTVARDRNLDEPGGLTAVAYWVERGDPLGSGSESDDVWALYRGVVSAERTFREFLATGSSGGTTWQGLDQPVDAFAAERRAENFLLANILSFSVEPMGPDSKSMIGDGDAVMALPGQVGETERREFPETIRIVLRVLSDEGASLVAAAERGEVGGLDLDQVAAEYGVELARRVAINPF